MAWFMQWLGGHGMMYGIAWRAWHGIWYVLAGMAWYMVLPGEVWDCIYCVAWQDDMYLEWSGGHGMVYGMVYRLCHDI